MPGELFYWVMNMSIIGSAVICVIAAIGRIKIIPRRAMSVLWVLPFLRLWIPIGLRSGLSVMNFIDKARIKTVTVYESVIVPEVRMSSANAIGGARVYFPIEYKTDILEKVFDISGGIWAAGCIVLLAAAVIFYVFAMREQPTEACVRGILRPKIYIPEGCGEDEKYIRLHEETHVKRKDNLWRLLGIATCILHWFNPIVWVALGCFEADLEGACDEVVLKECSKREYAAALLNAAERRSVFSSFGGGRTKKRIERILNYRRMTLVSAVCCGALIMAAAAVLLTNAK